MCYARTVVGRTGRVGAGAEEPTEKGEGPMRCLPFAMTRGPWFTQVLREAHQDRRRTAVCSTCGGTLAIEPDKAEQQARCQGCARWQTVRVEQETPWHLTPAAAAALRRTRSWLRRL